LPTQKECLEMLGCYGKDAVEKFAEICAAVVLAGDTSSPSMRRGRRDRSAPAPAQEVFRCFPEHGRLE